MDDFELEHRPRRRFNLLAELLPVLVCALAGAGLGALVSGEVRDFTQAKTQLGDVVNRDFLSADALGEDHQAPPPAPAAAEAAPGLAPVFPAAVVAARAGIQEPGARDDLRALGTGTRRAVLGRLSPLGPGAGLAQ